MAKLARNEPVLFFHWTPDPFHHRIRSARMSLPDGAQDCHSSSQPSNFGPLDCDYFPDTLRKLAWPHLPAAAPPAHEFLSRFTLKNIEVRARPPLPLLPTRREPSRRAHILSLLLRWGR